MAQIVPRFAEILADVMEWMIDQIRGTTVHLRKDGKTRGGGRDRRGISVPEQGLHMIYT